MQRVEQQKHQQQQHARMHAYVNPSEVPDSTGRFPGGGGQGHISAARGADQVNLWQNQYCSAFDSGVQSGVSTTAPSVYSNNLATYDEMEPDQVPPPPVPYEMQQQYLQHSYTPDQMDEINQQYFSTRSQRVRAAMFPETMEEGTEILATQMTEQPTAVGNLAEPAQMLKHAVTNIVNYQDDADLAVRIVPELVQLLQDSDKEVVSNTARFIYELSKKDASRFALMRDAQVVTAVVRAMESVTDPDTAIAAVGTMHNLSQHRDGLNVIFMSYGIPFLIKLLSFPVEMVQNYAISTLHNLIEHQPNAKAEVFKHSGIQTMVPLLSTRLQNLRFVTVVCDCLKHLTIGNQEAKVIILALNGPAELLRIMETVQYEKLLNATSGVLKAISVEKHNKRAILRANGIEILTYCVQTFAFETSRVQTNILYILRNLSDMLINDPEFKDKNFDQMLEMLVPLLGKEQDNGRLHPMVLCAAGILSNLTCNNQRNKMKVYQLRGIELLLQACKRYPSKEEITEPAVCTLRHITSRHPKCEEARISVMQVDGLSIVANMLKQPGNHWTLIKALVGFIHHLASVTPNRGPLLELGVTRRLMELMFESYTMIKQASVNQTSFATNVVVDNVRMYDVLEGTIGALFALSKDQANRNMIRNQQIVAALIDLIPYPVDNVQRFVSGLLSELTHDREGCAMLEHYGATTGLSMLVYRPRTTANDPAAIYCADALYRMSEGKSPEYRSDLYLQLTQAVSHGGDAWGSSEIPGQTEYEFMLASDAGYPHHYNTSGPSSVHGSVHGANLSVYEPDNMSGMDMAPYTPNPQVWEQYAAPTPTHYNQNPQHNMNYQNLPPHSDNASWKDSDV